MFNLNLTSIPMSESLKIIWHFHPFSFGLTNSVQTARGFSQVFMLHNFPQGDRYFFLPLINYLQT